MDRKYLKKLEFSNIIYLVKHDIYLKKNYLCDDLRKLLMGVTIFLSQKRKINFQNLLKKIAL